MNATSSPMTIDVQALKKTYPGGVDAVKGIDFDVGAGEVVGLLGPNGAGKSTTIGMLTTTIMPTSGTARLAGFDVAQDPIAARGFQLYEVRHARVRIVLVGGSAVIDEFAHNQPAAIGGGISRVSCRSALLPDRSSRDGIRIR